MQTESQKMTLQLVFTLDDWDPFEIGTGNYETEIADIIQAIHDFEDEAKLAKKIQDIYEFSFEKIIPMEKCKFIAEKLLSIKRSSSCAL